jgi:hypothetical protein
MESKLFGTLGKVAGIGGLALGVFLLIFQGVLKQNLLFAAGLSQSQAYYIVAALLLLTFGIAGIGIVAWLISRGDPNQPIHPGSILLLVLLVLLLFGATVYLFTLAAKEPATTVPQPLSNQKMTYKVCMGNGGGPSCMNGADAYFDCDFYRSVGGGGNATTKFLGERFCKINENGKVRQLNYSVRVYQNNAGGQCGWTGFEVTCTP